MRYYKLNEVELQKELDTDFENGLSFSKVDERFKECGFNTTYSKPALSFKSVNMIFLAVSSEVRAKVCRKVLLRQTPLPCGSIMEAPIFYKVLQ